MNSVERGTISGILFPHGEMLPSVVLPVIEFDGKFYIQKISENHCTIGFLQVSSEGIFSLEKLSQEKSLDLRSFDLGVAVNNKSSIAFFDGTSIYVGSYNNIRNLLSVIRPIIVSRLRTKPFSLAEYFDLLRLEDVAERIRKSKDLAFLDDFHFLENSAAVAVELYKGSADLVIQSEALLFGKRRNSNQVGGRRNTTKASYEHEI